MGARFDYAVAANLNLFASVFQADRVSHGYGWGFIRPQYDQTTGRVQYFERDVYTNPPPSIPDSKLGYEIDWGVDWKLLEGYTIRTQFGVWWPSRWFNFACIDRSNPDWKTPTPASMWEIIPERTIDPVFGKEVKLEANF